jgi:hypothetical protein
MLPIARRSAEQMLPRHRIPDAKLGRALAFLRLVPTL